MEGTVTVTVLLQFQQSEVSSPPIYTVFMFTSKRLCAYSLHPAQSLINTMISMAMSKTSIKGKLLSLHEKLEI